MQDASQNASAEKVPAKSRRLRRGPDEGNILWNLYSTMGTVRMKEFRDLLETHHIPLLNFNSQTKKDFKLSRMQAGRLQLYRDFFLESGVDLNDVVAAELAENTPAPATASQEFHANEQQG